MVNHKHRSVSAQVAAPALLDLMQAVKLKWKMKGGKKKVRGSFLYWTFVIFMHCIMKIVGTLE